ncbi:hypothetical protein AAFX91_14175 [Bradyrhizobium sp. 31Argb]|uniref:hypothetical protein n=1 Tax=unclassified Bradyrhizobium TaxID=2631580 RepID=UPI00102E6319|nr:hypothetical protein [Bradyrhizobium sp. Leo170]TAI60830.1 hypothetical protein CWO89_38550 [Bradyrhizobium sp. Leo170]
MFSVVLDDVINLVTKFDKLAEQVGNLHQAVPEELTAWQRDDMRRKYPNMTVTATGNQTAAVTLIWPRARFERPQPGKQATRGPKVYRPRGVVGRQPTSNRPILREELKDQLDQRMLGLTREAMKWP